MKTSLSVLAVCLALLATSGHAARIQRSLTQSPATVTEAVAIGGASCVAVNGVCSAEAQVSSQAINDAAASIASALAIAVAEADGDGDATAAATSFAQAIARAYAIVVSRHTIRVNVDAEEGSACAFTKSSGTASATAFARAVTSAFAQSSNEYARAAAACFSQAVATATVTAMQNAEFGACTNYGEELVYTTLTTVGYVEAIATAFSAVFTAIRNNDAIAAAACGAFGQTTTGTTTVQTGGSG